MEKNEDIQLKSQELNAAELKTVAGGGTKSPNGLVLGEIRNEEVRTRPLDQIQVHSFSGDGQKPQ